MPDVPETVEKGQAILAMEPLPEDAEEQLEELERRTPARFKFMFSDLYEGLYAAGGGTTWVPGDD